MSNTDNHHGSEADNNTIRPAQVSLNIGPASTNDANATDKTPWHEQRFMLFGIGIGLVLLVAVIFVLPNKVAVNVDSIPTAEPNPATTISQGPKESPWQEQQFAKERRETQEILAKLLDKQKQLEAIQVWEWADSEYNEAKNMAAQADIDYRRQAFLTAQQGYNNALTTFTQLLARSRTLYTESLAKGEQAILAGDDEAAKAAYRLASIIKPNEAAPKAGLDRAAVLSDVIATINEGKQLQRQGQLEEAKAQYQAALKLDSENLLAKQQIADVNNAIRDRDFGKQMSIGYAAINAQQYDKAVNAFKAATTIKPNASDAQAALVQARNEKTQADIQRYIQAAEQFERDEQWQQANDSFNQALALDKNLVAARVGAIRTEARAKVDTTLEEILAEPQRLATAAVHQDFTEYLAKTRSIPNPGPRLQAQIRGLELALAKAVEPVQIKLVSDSMTEVTVYRVGDLGLFEQKQLTLRPGTYTAIGKRNGYRDVRQEFTVSLDTNQPITIQCVEKIPKG